MEGIMNQAEKRDLITEKMIAWGRDDGVAERYPARAYFVAADSPSHGESVREAFSEGLAVVLVFPNGDEVVIEPAANGAPARVEVRNAAGQPLAA